MVCAKPCEQGALGLDVAGGEKNAKRFLNGRVAMNDSPVDCQNHEGTEPKRDRVLSGRSKMNNRGVAQLVAR